MVGGALYGRVWRGEERERQGSEAAFRMRSSIFVHRGRSGPLSVIVYVGVHPMETAVRQRELYRIVEIDPIQHGVDLVIAELSFQRHTIGLQVGNVQQRPPTRMLDVPK